MFKTTGLLAIAALFSIAPAAADEIKGEATFPWLAVGQAYPMGDGHPYFVGAFSGINMFEGDAGGPLANSPIMCPGYNDIGVDAAGYCIVTAGADKVYLKWQCKAVAPVNGDLATCEGHTDVVGGTGMFKDAKGGNDLVAHVRGINPDGTTSGYSELHNYVVTY